MEGTVNDGRAPREDGPAGREHVSPQDRSLLRELAAMWRKRDPEPEGLTDRVVFALDVLEAEQMSTADLDIEFMRIQDSPVLVAGARGSERESEAVRTVTFGSPSMTVMLSITPEASGFRIDGWVAPGGERIIDVRAGKETRETRTDVSGRFVLAGVPSGHLQLVLHRDTPTGTAAAPVVTPALTL